MTKIEHPLTEPSWHTNWKVQVEIDCEACFLDMFLMFASLFTCFFRVPTRGGTDLSMFRKLAIRRRWYRKGI